MWCSDSDSYSYSDSDSDFFCGSDPGEGKRKRSLARSLDYECVERFRLRRLLAFLQYNRYDGAYEALSKETAILFRTEHLQDLVRQGLWCDAIKYVYRFLPASVLPRHGKLLVKFIIFVLRINDHRYRYDPHSPFQIHLYGGVSRGGVKLAKIISSVRSDKACDSINWFLVRIKAAEIVGELVAQIPEFSDLCRLPLCSAKAANVLPIGLRSRCHKGYKKKSRMPAVALARSFLTMRRLTSSQGTSHSGKPLEPTMTQLAELVEECLQAGKCSMPNAKHPIESSCTEELEIHQDVVPGSNPKRPQAAEDQMIEARTLKITGKDSGLSSNACCFLGDETARDVGSNMNRHCVFWKFNTVRCYSFCYFYVVYHPVWNCRGKYQWVRMVVCYSTAKIVV